MRKFYTRKVVNLALLFLCFFVSSLSANATTYTFNGNGDWDIASNWAGNNIAPHTSGANTIIINGSLTTSVYTVISSGGTLTINGSCTVIDEALQNSGSITINNGGNLIFQIVNAPAVISANYNLITINAGGFLRNNGHDIRAIGNIILNGSLINNGPFYAGIDIITPTVTINNGATLTNNNFFDSGTTGSVVINNGGRLNSSSSLQSGSFTINTGGLLSNTGIISWYTTLTINSGSTFNNTGTILGFGTIVNNFVNPGTIAPGNSPGVITVNGNYTATSTAVHKMEIGGTAAAQYDGINSSGNVVVGGTLNAPLINGFVPSGNHNLAIISGNTVTGTFSTVNVPSGYSVQYNPTNVALQFGSSCVPPATPTANLIQPTCDIATGTITVTAPIGMTSYTVTGTSPVVAPVTQSGLVFAGLAEGTYNVTATNTCGSTSAPLSVTLKLDKADWTGAIDGNWHNAGNWNTGQVPTATTHVFILTGTPACRIQDADAHVASIQIQSGGALEILNGWQIVIHGNCVILPPHADYLPLTINNSWIYEPESLPVGSDSSILNVSALTYSAIGNTYKVLPGIGVDASTGQLYYDSSYVRKSGGDYYQYADYGSDFGFNDPSFAEIIFLKENVPQGTSWYSPVFSGMINIMPFTMRVKYTIEQKDVPVTVTSTAGTVNYTNVIIVESHEEKLVGGVWVINGSPLDLAKDYYARGIGWIKSEILNTGQPIYETNFVLRRYYVQ